MQASHKNTAMVLFPLSKKRIIKKTIEWTFVWFLIFFAIFFIPSAYSYVLTSDMDNIFLSIISFTFFISVVFFLNYFYQSWSYSTYSYNLTGESIVIRKNPLSFKTKTVFYDQVVDVSIYQGVWDKKFNLYNICLIVENGKKKEKIKISGFKKEIAEKFLDFIIRSQSFRLRKTDNISI